MKFDHTGVFCYVPNSEEEMYKSLMQNWNMRDYISNKLPALEVHDFSIKYRYVYRIKYRGQYIEIAIRTLTYADNFTGDVDLKIVYRKTGMEHLIHKYLYSSIDDTIKDIEIIVSFIKLSEDNLPICDLNAAVHKLLKYRSYSYKDEPWQKIRPSGSY